MLKKFIFITAAVFAVVGFQSQAFAQPPAPPASPAANAITQEEQAALEALQNALASATTTAEKEQILADAIAKTPTLENKPALLGAVQSVAISSGLSIAQISNAIMTGLSQTSGPVMNSTIGLTQTDNRSVFIQFTKESLEFIAPLPPPSLGGGTTSIETASPS